MRTPNLNDFTWQKTAAWPEQGANVAPTTNQPIGYDYTPAPTDDLFDKGAACIRCGKPTGRGDSTLCAHCDAYLQADELDTMGSRKTAKVTDFQHRHFNLIADAIRTAPVDEDTRGKLAEHFANHLHGTNENFDHGRFVGAATGNPHTQRDVHR